MSARLRQTSESKLRDDHQQYHHECQSHDLQQLHSVKMILPEVPARRSNAHKASGTIQSVEARQSSMSWSSPDEDWCQTRFSEEHLLKQSSAAWGRGQSTLHGLTKRPAAYKSTAQGSFSSSNMHANCNSFSTRSTLLKSYSKLCSDNPAYQPSNCQVRPRDQHIETKDAQKSCKRRERLQQDRDLHRRKGKDDARGEMHRNGDQSWKDDGYHALCRFSSQISKDFPPLERIPAPTE